MKKRAAGCFFGRRGIFFVWMGLVLVCGKGVLGGRKGSFREGSVGVCVGVYKLLEYLAGVEGVERIYV